MTNPMGSETKPAILQDNKVTMNSFLKDSYSHAKKQLEGSVTFLQDGVFFIKEEISNIYDKTGQYLNKMVLPVNNFLKDLTQIDSELQQEVSKESAHLMYLDGHMVPVEQALARPMEENY